MVLIDDSKRRSRSSSVASSPDLLDKPSAPDGLEVKKIETESVTIAWKPPADDGGADVLKYSIEKFEPGVENWAKVADVDSEITTYCIQKLQEGSEYMFRVFCYNEAGMGEAVISPAITVKNQFDKPSSPQGPLEVLGMSETSFTLKWKEPEFTGGLPIYYIVERREVGKKAWQKCTSDDEQLTQTSLEIVGLKTNTSYHFRITAVNSVGPSVPFAPEEAIPIGKRISKLTSRDIFFNIKYSARFKVEMLMPYCSSSISTNKFQCYECYK